MQLNKITSISVQTYRELNLKLRQLLRSGHNVNLSLLTTLQHSRLYMYNFKCLNKNNFVRECTLLLTCAWERELIYNINNTNKLSDDCMSFRKFVHELYLILQIKHSSVHLLYLSF